MKTFLNSAIPGDTFINAYVELTYVLTHGAGTYRYSSDCHIPMFSCILVLSSPREATVTYVSTVKKKVIDVLVDGIVTTIAFPIVVIE